MCFFAAGGFHRMMSRRSPRKDVDLDASRERVPAQVCVHSSLPPRRPQGQGPALLSLRRSRLGNTRHTPYTHSSALSGTAVGETPPEEKKKEKRLHRLFKSIKLLAFWFCAPLRVRYFIYHPLHCTCSTAGGILQLCISSLMCAGV